MENDADSVVFREDVTKMYNVESDDVNKLCLLMIRFFVFIYFGFVSMFLFFFSSRRRHTRFSRDWSSDVCLFRSCSWTAQSPSTSARSRGAARRPCLRR